MSETDEHEDAIARFYHFTDAVGARGILEDGEIRPSLHNVLGERMVWLTADPKAKASHLGLTRRRRGRFTDRDRMSHRFAVSTPAVERWVNIRGRFSEALVEMLEGSPGALPHTWYVCFVKIDIDGESVPA